MSRRRCPPKRSTRCMLCGDQVDELVEEMPPDFGASSPVHRQCAEWMIEAMRAKCPVCTGNLGLEHDHDLRID